MTPVYGDPEHPDRPTELVSSPTWTPEDQALVEGLRVHRDALCACDWPREIAWHSDMEGWFKGTRVVCHACTAAQGREVVHTVSPTTDRDFALKPLSPFVLGKTTTRPTEKATDSTPDTD